MTSPLPALPLGLDQAGVLRRARFSECLAQLGRLAVDARDPQVILNSVPVIATQALQVEVATVLLLEHNRIEFRIAGSVGTVSGEEPGALVPNRLDTAPGWVLARGQPITVADYRSEGRFVMPRSYRDAGLISALVVPLFDRGRVIGVLTVGSREPARFGDDEMRFLEALSDLLATSLQRAQTEEALNHAQRLESVGQLTGGIAHDFNNLLTIIQGSLQVLEEMPAIAQDGYAQQLVSAAARATRRGAELTSKLLTFSRRQVLQPSAIDVTMLLRSLSDMLRRTLDQRILIEVESSSDLPPVLADPGQLESALLNIAINARDAMPDGGTIRFRAEACAILKTAVRNLLEDPSAPHERFVALSVTDNGAGMTDDVRERAFEPFFTTKAAGRGTGLGLSTVYGFVKQSRGAITIDSGTGAGTTVTLYLPRPWHAVLPARNEETATSAMPGGLRVLLVEDDAEVRTVVRSFLDSLDCEVAQAGSGEQALSMLTSDAGFDLLLTDIALGAGMRGTRLADEAQGRFPQLAVLLTSGFSAAMLEDDRDSLPDRELLRKPYTRAALAQAITRALSGGARAS